jgi:hypothetical protein
VSAHIVEFWEMVGEQRTMVTPACLNCGWIGSDGTRPGAEEEPRMHERDERNPWQLAPGEVRPWQPGEAAPR